MSNFKVRERYYLQLKELSSATLTKPFESIFNINNNNTNTTTNQDNIIIDKKQLFELCNKVNFQYPEKFRSKLWKLLIGVYSIYKINWNMVDNENRKIVEKCVQFLVSNLKFTTKPPLVKNDNDDDVSSSSFSNKSTNTSNNNNTEDHEKLLLTIIENIYTIQYETFNFYPKKQNEIVKQVEALFSPTTTTTTTTSAATKGKPSSLMQSQKSIETIVHTSSSNNSSMLEPASLEICKILFEVFKTKEIDSSPSSASQPSSSFNNNDIPFISEFTNGYMQTITDTYFTWKNIIQTKFGQPDSLSWRDSVENYFMKELILLTEKHIPKIFKIVFLDCFGMEKNSTLYNVFFKWFSSLFIQPLKNINTIIRLWDCIFVFEFDFLPFIALHLLKHLEQPILQLHNLYMDVSKGNLIQQILSVLDLNLATAMTYIDSIILESVNNYRHTKKSKIFTSNET